jgi:chromosome segregation ATPase
MPATALIVETELQSAVQLHEEILIYAQNAYRSIYQMAIRLKQMKEGKAYKLLGFDNFDDYCKNSFNIDRTQAHKYIKVVETFGENVDLSQQNSISKLYLLTTVDEETRTDIMENSNLEEVTVRELREQITMLKSEKEKLSENLNGYEEIISNLSNENATLKKSPADTVSTDNEVKEELQEKDKKITELTKQLASTKFHYDTVQSSYKHLEQTNSKHYQKSCELEKQLEELQKRLSGETSEVELLKREEEIKRLQNEITELENRPPEIEFKEADTTIVECTALCKVLDEILHKILLLAINTEQENLKIISSKTNDVICKFDKDFKSIC